MKHGGPDALSRRNKGPDSDGEDDEQDIEETMDAALSVLFGEGGCHDESRPGASLDTFIKRVLSHPYQRGR